jgi:hypothetical protein
VKNDHTDILLPVIPLELPILARFYQSIILKGLQVIVSHTLGQVENVG